MDAVRGLRLPSSAAWRRRRGPGYGRSLLRFRRRSELRRGSIAPMCSIIAIFGPATRIGRPLVLPASAPCGKNSDSSLPALRRRWFHLSMAKALDAAFHVGGKVHVVTNGYDPESLKDVVPRDFGHFAIVFAGNLYPPRIVLEPVMAALQRLQATRKTSCPTGAFIISVPKESTSGRPRSGSASTIEPCCTVA